MSYCFITVVCVCRKLNIYDLVIIRMAKLSFVVLLAALVSFCAAQNNEIGNNKELLGYPKNVAVNWDNFMVRETYNIF